MGAEGRISDLCHWMGQQLHLTCLDHCFSKLQTVPCASYLEYLRISPCHSSVLLPLPVPTPSLGQNCQTTAPVTTWSGLEEVQGWGPGSGRTESVSVTALSSLSKAKKGGGSHKDFAGWVGGVFKVMAYVLAGPRPPRMSSFNHGGIPSCGDEVTVPGKVDQGRMIHPQPSISPLFSFFLILL